METLVTIVHVIVCIFLILVILLQAGKGAGMGILGGAGQTMFGGRGPATFLGKMTAGMAVTFMVTSMVLAWSASRQEDADLQRRAAEQAQKQPAATPNTVAPKAPKKTPPPVTPTSEADGGAANTNEVKVEVPTESAPAAAPKTVRIKRSVPQPAEESAPESTSDEPAEVTDEPADEVPAIDPGTEEEPAREP